MIMQWKKLIISIAISLGVGAIAGFITKDSIDLYLNLVKPTLAPPGWIFPIVWTILYILMGISAYIIFVSDSEYKEEALKIYALQLLLNFIWPYVFFNMQYFLLAFVILLLLGVAIYFMIVKFSEINPIAGKLQIPYLLWIIFAGYLNLSIYLLNS